jgi:hypothetical protein
MTHILPGLPVLRRLLVRLRHLIFHLGHVLKGRRLCRGMRLHTLPEGLPDYLLKDIGLTGQQVYLYRNQQRDPRGF